MHGTFAQSPYECSVAGPRNDLASLVLKWELWRSIGCCLPLGLEPPGFIGPQICVLEGSQGKPSIGHIACCQSWIWIHPYASGPQFTSFCKEAILFPHKGVERVKNSHCSWGTRREWRLYMFHGKAATEEFQTVLVCESSKGLPFWRAALLVEGMAISLSLHLIQKEAHSQQFHGLSRHSLSTDIVFCPVSEDHCFISWIRMEVHTLFPVCWWVLHMKTGWGLAFISTPRLLSCSCGNI